MVLFFNRLLVPHVVFWVLLFAGWYLQILSAGRVLVLSAGWLVALLVLSRLPAGNLWLTATTALVDVVLLLVVFRRDVKLW